MELSPAFAFHFLSLYSIRRTSPMDIQALSAQVALVLAPFLPYLLKGGIEAGKEAAKKLGDKFSEDTWEKSKSLWAKLHTKVETKPGAQEAARDVAEHPDDPDALAALRLQIKKLLTEDEEFTRAISELAQFSNSAQTKVEIHQHAGDNATQIGTAHDVNINK
jgi:hypothetical protein